MNVLNTLRMRLITNSGCQRCETTVRHPIITPLHTKLAGLSCFITDLVTRLLLIREAKTIGSTHPFQHSYPSFAGFPSISILRLIKSPAKVLIAAMAVRSDPQIPFSLYSSSYRSHSFRDLHDRLRSSPTIHAPHRMYRWSR